MKIHRTAAPFGKRLKEHEQPWYFERFEPVRQALIEKVPQLAKECSNRFLAQTAAVFLQVMDEFYGKDSPPEDRTEIKLPSKFFRDFSPSSPLVSFFEICLLYKDNEGWRQDGFVRYIREAPKAKKIIHFGNLFGKVKETWGAQGFLPPKKIFFSPPLAEDKEQAAKLRDIVQKHGGTVVDAENDATHIIIPDNGEGSEDDAEYLRTLEKRERMALVHWWYYPDSYDEWVPQHEVQGEAEPPQEHQGQWTVTSRYIRDLSVFNEWMNEDDYEPFEGGGGDEDEGANRAAEGGENEVEQDTEKKRKSSSKNSDRKKSRGNEDDDGHDDDHHDYKKVVSSSKTASIAPPPAPPSVLVRRTGPDHVIMPSYASWFSLNDVANVEKRAFPDFFANNPSSSSSSSSSSNETTNNNNNNNGAAVAAGGGGANKPPASTSSKTAALYKEYRNFIVQLYRENPRQYLTATDCRRYLAGDACAILRIHQFLEEWGVINYRTEPETAPPSLAVPNPLQQILLASPASSLFLGPHSSFPASRNNNNNNNHNNNINNNINGGGGGSSNRALKAMPSLSLRQNVFGTGLSSSATDDVVSDEDGARCTQCGTANVARISYQSAAMPGAKICAACVAAGHLPAGVFASDFVKVVAPPRGDDVSEWKESETLLLLQSIERNGHKNWDAVAREVGKSKEACLLHFIHLPIEDAFLDDHLPVSAASTALPTFPLNVPPARTFSAAADAVNPALIQVAYLLTEVDPSLVSAATSAALSAAAALKSDDKDGDTEMADAASGAARAAGLKIVSQLALAKKNEEEEKMRAEVMNAMRNGIEKLRERLNVVKQIEKITVAQFLENEKTRVQLAAERTNVAPPPPPPVAASASAAPPAEDMQL